MSGQVAGAGDPSGRWARDPVDALRRAGEGLDHGFPVIIVDGAPLAGVTRSVIEAARTCLPKARLISLGVMDLADWVQDPGFAEQFAERERYVVWLDDLSPADLVLLGTGVLDALSPHATVLASINSVWCERILADRSPVTGPARTVLLEYAMRVTVPFELTAAERTRMRSRFPGLTFDISIGETFVGGEALVRRYDAASERYPDGHLLVQAAVDARRCGLHRGLSEPELQQLFQQRKGGRSPRQFGRSLRWATQRQNDTASGLLFPEAGGDGEPWRVHSYVAAADDGNRGHIERTIPDIAWTAALDAFPAEEAYAVGIAAHLRGRRDIAVAAFRRAAVSRSAPGAAAADALQHLEDQGDAR